EFEDALDGLPGVRPGCAVAVGCDTGEGEELVMLVERAVDSVNNVNLFREAQLTMFTEPALAEAISARVVERTGIRPQRVHLLAPGTLPRTSSGKLRRGEALRLLLAGELRAPAPVTLLRLAREAARSMAARLRSGL